jgi:hypothetical protein
VNAACIAIIGGEKNQCAARCNAGKGPKCQES